MSASDRPLATADDLEALFREHHAALCDFALRFVSDAGEAEDVVHDVFLAVWRGRARLRIRTTMRAYLHAAVRNTALKRARHGALVRRLMPRLGGAAGDAPAGMGEAPPDPDATAVRGESLEQVDAAIATLSPRTRLAIELRYLRQMRHAEIAEAMGISNKGVEKLLATGIERLRERLVKNG